VLGDFFHQFGDDGFTGTLVLAESHIAIHTWPETSTVALDVFVCNHSRDNSDKAQQLFNDVLNLLKPKEVIRQAVQRGRL
jgi:spermidine synthase